MHDPVSMLPGDFHSSVGARSTNLNKAQRWCTYLSLGCTLSLLSLSLLLFVVVLLLQSQLVGSDLQCQGESCWLATLRMQKLSLYKAIFAHDKACLLRGCCTPLSVQPFA